MMTELDMLKSEWNSLAAENASLKEKNRELTRLLQTRNVVSSQEKLARNYRVSYMGYAFPLLGYMLYAVMHWSAWLAIAYGVYGVAIACYDTWFIQFVKSADFTLLPTVEAIDHAVKVVKYQNRATISSVLLAIIILIPMFDEMWILGGEPAVVGGITGGVLGGAIGLRIYIRNHRLARRMVKELKDMDN